MNVFARRLLGGGFVVCTVLGGFLFASTIVDAQPDAKFSGDFALMPAGEGSYEITGKAKMKVGTASTTVKIEVMGLNSDEIYVAHLHNGACADGGGGHYQDVEGGATAPPNEIWLSSYEIGNGVVLFDGETEAGATGSADWAARTDATDATNARSVVIHGGGAKIACADLAADNGNGGGRANNADR